MPSLTQVCGWPSPRPGWVLSVATGLAGIFLNSVLVENLWGQGFEAWSPVLCRWSLVSPSREALGRRGTTDLAQVLCFLTASKGLDLAGAFIVVN